MNKFFYVSCICFALCFALGLCDRIIFKGNITQPTPTPTEALHLELSQIPEKKSVLYYVELVLGSVILATVVNLIFNLGLYYVFYLERIRCLGDSLSYIKLAQTNKNQIKSGLLKQNAEEQTSLFDRIVKKVGEQLIGRWLSN